MPTDFLKAYLEANEVQRKAALEALKSSPRSRDTKPDEDLRLVTSTEAAKRLNVSRPTVYRMVKRGRIETVTLDGVRRIRLQSLIDFANGLTH